MGNHIATIIPCIRKCHCIIKELCNILDVKNINMIYFAVVKSILMYGIIIIRGSAYKNALEPLNVTHRILVRIMFKHFYNENNHTDDLFKILKLLKIGQLPI